MKTPLDIRKKASQHYVSLALKTAASLKENSLQLYKQNKTLFRRLIRQYYYIRSIILENEQYQPKDFVFNKEFLKTLSLELKPFGWNVKTILQRNYYTESGLDYFIVLIEDPKFHKPPQPEPLDSLNPYR